jgi:N-methylhydantoinase A
MQFANIVGEYASSQPTIANRFDYVGVNKVLANLKAEMDAFAARIGKRGLSKARYEYYVEARYLFQVWELEVPLSIEQFEGPASVEALVESFHEAHRRIFAVVDESSPVECLNWKARVVIPVAEPNLPKVEHRAGAAEPVSRRSVFFGNNDRTQADIYHGHDLKPGSKLRGPAVIEEPTTTIVVYPGSSAFVSASDNYVIKPNLAGE